MKAILWALCVGTGAFFYSWAEAEAPALETAAITKIDGTGVARLRRAAGMESVAGEQQKLFVGDKLTTDANTVVEIALLDGTLLRVGANSEYRVEAIEKKGGLLTWVFHLAKGSLRALVEKRPGNTVVKFRVNTPVGTVGVRGTELLIDHNVKTQITTLYTIEGKVEFGARKCAVKKACIDVNTGEKASIGADQSVTPKATKASAAEVFGLQENVGELREGGKTLATLTPEAKAHLISRGNLFTEMRKSESFSENVVAAATTPIAGTKVDAAGSIEAMLKQASEAMAAAQDKIIGRTAEEREQLHRAMADGSLENKLKLAEKFDDVVSKKPSSKAAREKENFSAGALTTKLKLAESILKSKTAVAAAARMAAAKGKLDPESFSVDGYTEGMSLEALMALGQKNLRAAKAHDAVVGAKNDDGTMVGPPPVHKSATATSTATLTDSDSATATATATSTSSGTSTGTDTGADDEVLADALLSDVTVDAAYQSYSYKKRVCVFWIFCDTKTIDETEVVKTEGTKVKRVGGICYETKKICDRKMIPCDLSKGKFCKPTFTDYVCTETKKTIPCP